MQLPPEDTVELPAGIIKAIPPEKAHEQGVYELQSYQVNVALADGKLTVGQANAYQKYIADEFHRKTGKTLQDAIRERMSPLQLLQDELLLEQNDKQLGLLEDGILGVRGLPPEKKTRWLELIARTRRLQDEARRSAFALWVYACRDQEGGKVFKPAKIHRQMFESWKSSTNTLTMAPPGHGKSTAFRALKAWRLGKDITRRSLCLHDTDDKARKEIKLLRAILTSRPYMAVFPEVRVMGRLDDAEDSSKRFTVFRPNDQSREPSFEAASAMSNTQGNGYDDIYVDDIVKPDCAIYSTVRDDVNFKWKTEHSQRLRDPARSRVHIVATPWHEDDVYGQIEKDHAAGLISDWEITKNPILTDNDGKPIPIWPERFGVKFLTEMRAKLSASQWSRLYELKANPDSDRLIHHVAYYPVEQGAEWDRQLHPAVAARYRKRAKQIAEGEIWLSIDPSATTGKNSSHDGIVVFSMTAQGYAYVQEVHYLPGDPAKRLEWIVEKITTQRIDYILVEAQGGMKGQVELWRHFIYEKLAAMKVEWPGSYLTCKPVSKHSGQLVGKRKRLNDVAGLIENGWVKFPARLSFKPGIQQWVPNIPLNESIELAVRQLVNFPQGASDIVDAITQWMRHESIAPRLHPETRDKNAPAQSQLFGFALAQQTAMKGAKKALTEEPQDFGDDYEWQELAHLCA